jgi:hypothetical protein
MIQAAVDRRNRHPAFLFAYINAIQADPNDASVGENTITDSLYGDRILYFIVLEGLLRRALHRRASSSPHPTK